MLDPINTNTRSKDCANPMGSDCVFMSETVDGSGLCKGASLTQVVNNLTTRVIASEGCCEGDFPPGHISAYTGKWVNFVSSIPVSGTTPNFNWALGNFGSSGYNAPEYKWTKDGDLLIRGNLDITITQQTYYAAGVNIPILALPPINFPTGWTGNQSIALNINGDFTTQVLNIEAASLIMNFPTGVLYFSMGFTNVSLSSFTKTFSLGGSRFNLA